jgi:hypothetical protein
MENVQLREFVSQSLAQGMRPDEIRASLASQGWTGPDIDQALAPPPKPASPRPSGRRRIWPFIVLAVVLLAGGGVYAAYRFGLFGPSPEEVIAASFDRLSKAKTIAFDFTARATYDQKSLPDDPTAQGIGAVLGPTISADGQRKPLIITGSYAADFSGQAAKHRLEVSIMADTTDEAEAGRGRIDLGFLNDGSQSYIDVARMGEGYPEALRTAIAGSWYALPKPDEGKAPTVSSTATEAVRALIGRSAWLIHDPEAPKTPGAVSAKIDEAAFKAFLKELGVITGMEIGEFTLVSGSATVPVSGEPVFSDVTAGIHVTTEKGGQDIGIVLKDVTASAASTIIAPTGAKGIEELIFGFMFGAMAGLTGDATGTIDLTPKAAPGTPSKEDVVAVMRALRTHMSMLDYYPESLAELASYGIELSTVSGDAWTYERGDDRMTFSLNVSYSAGPGSFGFIGFTERDLLPETDSAFDDKDGLGRFDEFAYGTDDQKDDTDGDGYKDGDEVRDGYDPNGPGTLP